MSSIAADIQRALWKEWDNMSGEWTVQLSWIDPELESHRLTDNLRRFMIGCSKVDKAYMDMVEQGFEEEILWNELPPSW